MTTPLFMRLEVQHSRQTFLDWISILGNHIGLSKESIVREWAFRKWEQHLSQNVEKKIIASRQRWVRMLHDLKIREPHSTKLDSCYK